MAMNAAKYGMGIATAWQTQGAGAALDRLSYDFGYQVVGGGTEAMLLTGLTMPGASLLSTGAVAAGDAGGLGFASRVRIVTGGSSAVDYMPTAAQVAAAESVAAQGPASVLSNLAGQFGAIDDHLLKLADALQTGGYTSTMLRTIRNARRNITALDDVARRLGINI